MLVIESLRFLLEISMLLSTEIFFYKSSRAIVFNVWHRLCFTQKTWAFILTLDLKVVCCRIDIFHHMLMKRHQYNLHWEVVRRGIVDPANSKSIGERCFLSWMFSWLHWITFLSMPSRLDVILTLWKHMGKEGTFNP